MFLESSIWDLFPPKGKFIVTNSYFTNIFPTFKYRYLILLREVIKPRNLPRE